MQITKVNCLPSLFAQAILPAQLQNQGDNFP